MPREANRDCWRVGSVAVAVLGLAFAAWVEHEYHRSQAVTYAHAKRCNSIARDFTSYSSLSLGERLSLNASELLTKRLRDLRPGMTQQQVAEILGKPSFTDAGMDNLGAGYWWCDWDYVLKSEDETLLDHIHVRFDKADLLKEWERVDQYGNPIK